MVQVTPNAHPNRPRPDKMNRSEWGLHAAGQRASLIQVLVALLLVLEICKALGSPHEPEGFLHDLPPYEVVHPTRVDARGHFLSNILSHHARRVQRRETSEERTDSDRVFYQFLLGGHSLHLNLTLNPNLLAPGFTTERRYGGLEGAKIHRPGVPRCHYLGEVWDRTSVKGSAAISTCNGLTGLFKLSEEEFFIQPLETSSAETSAPQAHAIYKRHASPPVHRPVVQPISGKPGLNGTCGNQNILQSFEDIERQRERWERRHHKRRRRIHQRSVSREKWVETLVVADPKMVDHHGSKAVEDYVLAVMNIVAGLFRDASIGNAVNVVVVRLILLEQDEDDLKITHHADNSLNSFCKWQKKLNMKGDEHPLHHDVAVLLTRKDICAAINMPCETLGLSHVGGMCQPHRSCSISEDTGLPMAFTVAHELGHNFGIQHDGNGNDCEPIGKRPFVMSPQLLYGTFLPRWSRCSRQYITRFLDHGWGWCLDDAPVKDGLSLTLMLPGELYSAAHQCRLQYGSGSRLCDDVDDVCSTLWCTVGTTCHSKLDGAVDGTSCGEDKWCINGECVPSGLRPESVHGGWASWSEWSACSRTCGAGVQSAERDCDNPVPKHRGNYCLGERRRYRLCNTTPCQADWPSFRNIQCTHFNTLPYKGKFYKWEAVTNKVNPCELHCRPFNENFSEKMRDAVADGTPCYEGNKSRDMCINGVCQSIGCDYVINSSSVEDRCGVCNGNGSTCTTVRRTFEEREGFGYVDIGLIPEGAWDILIEEVTEAGNFLALRSDIPNKYFLNGGWTIQWNGEYKAAGAVFTYERTGQLENLTSPGPTMEPLWIQLLFQETNPGVRYEYTVSQSVSEDGDSPGRVYFWKYGSWTECSVTCGRGVQRQIVFCVEKTTGIAEEHLCDPSIRLDGNQTSCRRDPCPAIWWVGDWHKCSASCGSLGQAKRTVLCVQAVSAEEQEALDPSDCKHIPKPESTSACNTHIPCPADWNAGSWSKCSVSCGPGLRHRNVTCSRNTAADCDPLNKPSSVTGCQVQDCLQVLGNFGDIEWSGSGWSSKEVLNEINTIPEAKPPPKFSITKGQPRSQNDHKYAVEDDFHYHNNIENNRFIDDNEPSHETSVHIDDFYYDYNFINFHEDLSNELGRFGEEQEDNSPQEAKPTHSMTANAWTEIPQAPTATSPAVTITELHLLQSQEPQSTKTDDTQAKSEEVNQDEINDFLYEDHFLPVSATRPSPPSKNSHTRAGKKGKSLWPGGASTMQSLVFSTKQPAEDETWGQSGEEVENNGTAFSEEENHLNRLAVSPTHSAPAARHQTTAVATKSNAREEAEFYISADKNAGSSEPLGFPLPEKATHAVTELDSNVSEIPQTASQDTATPDAFTIKDWMLNQNNVATSDDGWWDQLGTRSPLPSHEPFPPAIPLLLISGTQSTSDDSISVTETEVRSDKNLQGATNIPPDVKQIPLHSETTGTDPTFQPPSFRFSDFDHNEISVPSVTQGHGNSHPDPSYRSMITSAVPKFSSAPPQRTKSTMPRSLPTHPPGLWLHPVQMSDSGPAFWVTGNWSTCSTSCGLGAVWRTLVCSTGSESDCDQTKRPAPARQCYLRPCSTWKVGEWSRCTKNCEGGMRFREVQCFDLRNQRPLRPFHCRAMFARPLTQMPCNVQTCLDWYTSSWGQCSEVCGGGEQQRIVTCPEDDRCDQDLQPSAIQSCNSQPCAQWLTGSWGQCSASCGGGLQHRLIKCVDTRTEASEEVDQVQCDHKLKPSDTKKCNVGDCKSDPSGAVCLRDRLASRICHTLRSLSHCHQSSMQARCCKTCSRDSGMPLR
ncbi:A disintegrin and metalloproteinase with thrombospondin motifs 12 isoform X1 [Gambusia affinis]|uniref:A disintegrin and metalloproteinase with thrombospondin motifs 12 isoform X1 n=1 Tax=Gambusia affinis TaxID=33528 RepID=UPI001CDCF5F0|nr:A disintegrin and metalloproteinase with thrombospondin motifs 12 isoform X1 [Gambusia affinis]